MDALEQLRDALECPCCLNKPEPNTSVVGMCFNGHMICEPCGSKIIHLNTVALCPVCRTPNFHMVRGHYLAVSIIKILTAFLIYTCKHDNCLEQRNGNEIAEHEARCIYKPMQCPKEGCNFKAPLDLFMDGIHHSCLLINDIQEDGEWSVTINFDLIYSFDQNEVHVSSKFQPIILHGVSPVGLPSRAYVNIVSNNNGLVIYPGWFDNNGLLPQQFQHLKIDIFAYINTQSGKVGLYSSKSPVFENEKVKHGDDGIYIPKPMVYNWAKWSRQNKCHECVTNKRQSHLHLRVKFNI